MQISQWNVHSSEYKKNRIDFNCKAAGIKTPQCLEIYRHHNMTKKLVGLDEVVGCVLQLTRRHRQKYNAPLVDTPYTKLILYMYSKSYSRYIIQQSDVTSCFPHIVQPQQVFNMNTDQTFMSHVSSWNPLSGCASYKKLFTCRQSDCFHTGKLIKSVEDQQQEISMMTAYDDR